MAEQEHPQIYLITPPEFELSSFPDQLAKILDTFDIACVRVALATRDEDRLSRAADAIREVCYPRDTALVMSEHVLLAQRLGLDGVHLLDGSRSVRKIRKDLGDDAIVGSFCGASRHDGMSAGESGADYVAFGPVGSASLGDGSLAEPELFAWWSEMIEVPVVAEGDLHPEIIKTLAPVTDFFGIGEEVWRHDDPSDALKTLTDHMK